MGTSGYILSSSGWTLAVSYFLQLCGSIKSVQPFCNEVLLKDVSKKLNESPLIFEFRVCPQQLMHDMEIMKEL